MLQRFTLYESAFPMVTYRVILAREAFEGDRIMVPDDLDQDNVEMSFMGDPFRVVSRCSNAGPVTQIHLADGDVLRLDDDRQIILDVSNIEEKEE